MELPAAPCPRAQKATRGLYTGTSAAARAGGRPHRQEGHAAPRRPSRREAAAWLTLPKALLLLIFPGWWVTQTRNRDGKAPGSPPRFRKGSFGGNPFCKFPSTDDLRAALPEVPNAGHRRRWCADHGTLFLPSLRLLCCSCPARQGDAPLHSCPSPDSIVPLPAFSSSVPVPFFPSA